MRFRKFIIFFAVCVFIAGILIASKDYYLPLFGSFLVIKDDLKPADAVIVLGGEEERIYYAVKLYKQKLVKYIVITGGGVTGREISIAGWLKIRALKSGVPEKNILLETKAEHTYQHPIFVKPILVEHGFTSAIVVSSPYHMRRSVMLFNRAFRMSGINLTYIPVADSWFKSDRWWKSSDGRRIVFSEYIKLAVDMWGVKVSDRACALLKEKKWSILVTR
ncbi:MAG: YdcF family protein [Candidatus Omnitrophota bacterium]